MYVGENGNDLLVNINNFFYCQIVGVKYLFYPFVSTDGLKLHFTETTLIRDVRLKRKWKVN